MRCIWLLKRTYRLPQKDISAQAAKPLNKWIETIKAATWKNHSELKQMFPSADYVKNGRYVFNIGGNRRQTEYQQTCLIA